MCLDSIRQRLHSVPLLLQLPVYDKGIATKTTSGLVGVVDLVRMERLIFDSSSKGLNFQKRKSQLCCVYERRNCSAFVLST